MKKITGLVAIGFATALTTVTAGNWFTDGFDWNNSSKDMDIIVNGSLTGSTNAIAQLIAKDSQSGTFPGIKLTAVAPGNACKGFALIKQRPADETFVTYYENYYQLVAKQKNDASCPYISFENATPIVSYVQSLYLITNEKTLADFGKQKLKIGYSGTGPEKDWHDKLTQKFSQDHTFVAYSGTGNLRSGMASGEVDAIWTTYRHFLKLKDQKDQYTIVMRTLDTLDVDAPILAEYFNDTSLSRAFLSGWYVFNDDGTAKTISDKLASDVKNNTGEFGKYANTKKLILTFDQPTQKEMEKNLSWDQ